MITSIMKSNKNKLENILAVLAALVLWQVAAMLLSQEFLLASPVSVIKKLLTLFSDGGVFSALFYSFSRIIGGFFIGLAAGVVLAIFASRSRLVENLLRPYMVTVKTVPIASFIVIALIWLSSSRLSVFISFLIVLPVIYNNILNGIKNTDKKMTEMAEVFSLPWRKKFFYITLPQIKPFLRSGCQTAVGFAFKSGIAAEIIGIPGGSLGEKLYSAKVHLETAELFAWTVLIVVASVLCERLFIALLDLVFKGVEKR